MSLFGRRRDDVNSATPEDAQPKADSGGEGALPTVQGERGIPSVNRVRSLQSRVSSLLALCLMLGLGFGLLGWYYAHQLTRPAADGR